LAHLKQRIDENSEIDPGFQKLFVKAMLSMLKEQSKKVQIIDPNDMSKDSKNFQQ